MSIHINFKYLNTKSNNFIEYSKRGELIRVYHNVGEVKRTNGGQCKHNVATEEGAVFKHRVLGEAKDIHTNRIGHKLGVNAWLCVDGLDFIRIHTKYM